MKYIEEFRDSRLAAKLADAIRAEVKGARPDGQKFRYMEFCGGHTHAIYRFGLPDILPPEVEMVHGPGCPVCVLPMAKIDAAIQLAQLPNVTLCSYGDMMRVPGGQRMSLLKAKAAGADVRMVTSPHDALMYAKENPGREVIFFAIGFETTTPPTAVVVKMAAEWGLKNFSVFCNHVLTPPALKWLLEASAQKERVIPAQAGLQGHKNPSESPGPLDPRLRGDDTKGEGEGSDVPPLDGFVGPSHVSAIIGTKPYEIAATDYGKPVVIAGFEPLDVMQAILMLIRQTKTGRAEVENEYSRAVTREGNMKAQALMAEVFDLRDTFEWRGLGWIPNSALKLKDEYAAFDTEKRFPLAPSEAKENPACQCPAILRGAKTPEQCPLFGKVCTPENPIGACMVSSEGGCAAWYSYGRRGK